MGLAEAPPTLGFLEPETYDRPPQPQKLCWQSCYECQENTRNESLQAWMDSTLHNSGQQAPNHCPLTRVDGVCYPEVGGGQAQVGADTQTSCAPIPTPPVHTLYKAATLCDWPASPPGSCRYHRDPAHTLHKRRPTCPIAHTHQAREGRRCLREQQRCGQTTCRTGSGRSIQSLIPMCLQGSRGCAGRWVCRCEQNSQVSHLCHSNIPDGEMEETLDKKEDSF